MIRLRGLRTPADIAIQFTALRPGEKLHEQLFFPDEAPLAFDACVFIPVLDRSNLPLPRIGLLQLVAAVHDAVRVVRIVEVDDVIGDLVNGGSRLAHRLREPRFECITTRGVASDANIGGEQLDQGIHVAGVERECVPVGKLAYCGQRLHSVESLLDHLQREEVLLLLMEDPSKPRHVRLVELAIPRRGSFRVDEPLALEEANLRDRDVRELLAQDVENLADRQVRRVVVQAAARVHAHACSSTPPSMNRRTNRPTWTSSRCRRGDVSTRSWFT